MADSERERQALVAATSQQVAEARAEGESLRRLVKLKTRELKNVRRLAQEVLLQRSDVETFLLSSLHTVSLAALLQPCRYVCLQCFVTNKSENTLDIDDADVR